MPFQRDIETFVTRLQNQELVGSAKVALETVTLLRLCISSIRWQTADHLIDRLRTLGRSLISHQHTELAVGNIVRRVLRIIRDEYKSIPEDAFSSEKAINEDFEEEPKWAPTQKRRNSASSASHLLENMYHRMKSGSPLSETSMGLESESSMYNLIEKGKKACNYNVSKFELKPLIMQAINELVDELETYRNNITTQALEHIQNGETILTLGKSKTVEEFIIHAGKKRTFKVYVAETAPLYDGHILAENLANAGIDVTLIVDSAVGGIMERVNKVIIGCHAVMANGGLIAVTGTRLVAVSAAQHATPVVILSGLYKLTPSFASQEDFFIQPITPAAMVNQDDCMFESDKVDVLCPYFDYVDPKYVTIFLTNVGGHPPTYIYRLLNEFYDPLDNDLDQ